MQTINKMQREADDYYTGSGYSQKESKPATWTDGDVVRIYIKLIEAKGEYHQAQDVIDIKAAIEEYKQQKNGEV